MIRLQVARHGESVLKGAFRHLAELIVLSPDEQTETTESWLSEGLYNATRILGTREAKEIFDLAEKLREQGKDAADPRRLWILRAFEWILLNHGRFLYRAELRRFIAAVEEKDIERIDATQVGEEAEGLGLPLSDAKQLANLRKALIEDPVLALLPDERFQLWRSFPRGYCPMKFWPPDFLCHFFTRQIMGERRSFADRASIDLTLAQIRGYLGNWPDSSISPYIRELETLSDFTYGGEEAHDIISPSALRREIADWPLDPTNARSVIDELNLQVLDAFLSVLDINHLERIKSPGPHR